MLSQVMCMCADCVTDVISDAAADSGSSSASDDHVRTVKNDSVTPSPAHSSGSTFAACCL